MSKRTFTDVSFVAEHVPETHRTLENDHTVTSVELPGMVTVYLVIDGGRLPFTQLRGADVLEAIDRAESQRQTQESARAESQAPAEPTAPYDAASTSAPEQTQQQPPAVPGAPFKESALGIDLSARIVASTTVVASPADNTETIIASVTVPGGLSLATGIIVVAFAAFTVGTSGTAVNLRIRQTTVAGTVKAASGAVNEGVTAATQLGTRVVAGLDVAPVDGQIYKATLEVTGGAAASAVSAVFLAAIAVQMEAPWLGRAGFGENADRLPLNNPSKVLENFRVVKDGDGWLYGFTVTNTKGSAQFVLVFDARDLPAEGAVPLIAKSIPAGDAVGFSWLPPRRFEAGLVLCNSTTQGAKTLGAADCLFDAQYVQGRGSVPIISGGGGAAFNGGTITNDLLVNATTGVPITARQNDGSHIAEFEDDASNVVSFVDARGSFIGQPTNNGALGLRITAPAAANNQVASFGINGVGNTVILGGNDNFGIANVHVDVAGNDGVQPLVNIGGSIGGLTGILVIRKGATPSAATVGFFGHALAAQQTLTSGTATPEQIALALQANGFCGGTQWRRRTQSVTTRKRQVHSRRLSRVRPWLI